MSKKSKGPMDFYDIIHVMFIVGAGILVLAGIGVGLLIQKYCMC